VEVEVGGARAAALLLLLALKNYPGFDWISNARAKMMTVNAECGTAVKQGSEL
jgi:hypothetical protein